MPAKSEKIILGIDPGTTIMGYGIIRIVDKKMELVHFGEIILQRLPNHQMKLKKIFERVLNIIDEYNPDEMALEAPFFGKNVQSMLKLGRAQGVAMAAGLFREVPITEYAPKKIKMAITGNGTASKEQVAGMLMRQFKIKDLPKHLDGTDGLAVAVCHFYNMGKPDLEKNYSSWDTFVKQNPDRIKP
ncbi:MAG: crossover junction endodeoxyribonuclease RuvC [Flavobacteriales bacterium]